MANLPRLTFLLPMLLALSAQAAQPPRRYVSVVAGGLTPAVANFHDGAALNAGIGFGLRFQRLPGVSAEAIWTGCAIARSGADAGSSSGDINYRAGGLFAAWRGRGQPYLKGRIGVSRVTVYDAVSKNTRIAAAAGAGLGWHVPEGALELEQTYLNDDAWLLSISYLYDLY